MGSVFLNMFIQDTEMLHKLKYTLCLREMARILMEAVAIYKGGKEQLAAIEKKPSTSFE